MAWDTVPAPNYPTANGNFVGNALSNLVGNYQGAQLGNQQIQQGDLRTKQDQMLLDQSKAFAGGLPMNADGTPNYASILKTLAEKGDIGSIGSLAPILQQQQNIQGANAPDPILGGGGSSINSGGTGKGGSAPASGPWSSNPFLSTTVEAESGGKEGPDVRGDSGQAKGFFQFHDSTWQRYAKNVPGADQYASAEDAPADVQQAVAETAPISEWGPRTKAILHSKFGNFDESQTIGTLAGEFGGKGGGTQVASAGASDATAYASPDTPKIPPVSAAAGSSIPRQNSQTAASGGAPAGGSPLAANNPAWAGLNASLPVGPSGTPAQSPAAPAPRAPLPPSQGSVASIASAAKLPPQVVANIAKAIGAAPDAPLTPEQAQKAQTIVQNYAQRAQAGQQQPTAAVPGAAAPSGANPANGGGAITPQFQLPPGAKDPQQAIMMIDQDIARLGRFGPAANDRIRALEDYRERIAKASAPMDVRPGQTILDPATGKTLFQAPSAASLSPANAAITRYLEENPDASPEDIQRFAQQGKGVGRSAASIYMNRFMQENPNASAEDVAKAAQDFTAQSSSVTKFDTGKQGDAVRSFNVLVDHLGTLGDAAAALKNGNIQIFNKAVQGWAKETGLPAPTDFAATRAIVGDELVKAIVGGGGALGDREEIKGAVDAASSPQQLAGVINKYKELALGQLKGLRKQYESSTGRDDFDTKLAPGTKAFFGDKDDKKSGDSGGLPAGWSVVVH